MKVLLIFLVAFAVVHHIVCNFTIDEDASVADEMRGYDPWLNRCSEKNINRESCICPTLKSLQTDIQAACFNNSSNNNTGGNTTKLQKGKTSTTKNLSMICLKIEEFTLPCSTCIDIESYQNNCTHPKYIQITEKDKEINQMCLKHNLTNKDCNCETLYTKEDHTVLCGNQTENILIRDIHVLCQAMDISKEKCKCPDLKISIPAFGKEVCNFFKEETETNKPPCTLDGRVKVQTGFTLMACVFGIIGNLLVLVVRSQQWSNSIHYKLISGLASADLLFSVLQMLYNIPKLIGCKWAYGLVMCKLLHSLLGLSYSIDLGFIVIIAIERYIVIVHPFSDVLTNFRVCVLLLVNMAFSILAVVPSFIVLTIDKTGRCNEEWKGHAFSSLGYSWLLFIVYFLLPVIVIVVLYRSSMLALQRSLKRRMSAVSDASRSRLSVENRRILMVISALLIALVVLVCPNRIIWLAIDYIGSSNMSADTLIALKIIVIVPYSLHIMVNPIIYSLVDRRFRKNAMFLLKNFKRNTGGIGLSNDSNSNSGAMQLADRPTNHTTLTDASNGELKQFDCNNDIPINKGVQFTLTNTSNGELKQFDCSNDSPFQ